MPKFEQIIYEVAESGIVRVVLNRAEARNAQDTHMPVSYTHLTLPTKA